jgi:ATP synthase protein I
LLAFFLSKKNLDISKDLPYLRMATASEISYNLRDALPGILCTPMLGKETRKIFEQLVLVSQLGLTMVGCIGLGFATGYYLDKWLRTKGIFLTIFILLGIAGGGFTVYRQIKEMESQETDGSAEDDSP